MQLEDLGGARERPEVEHRDSRLVLVDGGFDLRRGYAVGL
jgi:hypothetical protein